METALIIAITGIVTFVATFLWCRSRSVAADGTEGAAFAMLLTTATELAQEAGYADFVDYMSEKKGEEFAEQVASIMMPAINRFLKPSTQTGL